jgi:hypothetical protein
VFDAPCGAFPKLPAPGGAPHNFERLAAHPHTDATAFDLLLVTLFVADSARRLPIYAGFDKPLCARE